MVFLLSMHEGSTCTYVAGLQSTGRVLGRAGTKSIQIGYVLSQLNLTAVDPSPAGTCTSGGPLAIPHLIACTSAPWQVNSMLSVQVSVQVAQYKYTCIVV